MTKSKVKILIETGANMATYLLLATSRWQCCCVAAIEVSLVVRYSFVIRLKQYTIKVCMNVPAWKKKPIKNNETKTSSFNTRLQTNTDIMEIGHMKWKWKCAKMQRNLSIGNFTESITEFFCSERWIRCNSAEAACSWVQQLRPRVRRHIKWWATAIKAEKCSR